MQNFDTFPPQAAMLAGTNATAIIEGVAGGERRGVPRTTPPPGAVTPPDSRTAVQVDVLLPEEDDAPTVVRLRGELDVSEVRTVDDELAPVVARTDGDVIIDVEDLQFIDVGGLNLLARTAGTLTAADRVLRLRAPSPILLRMLHVTGLDEHVEIVDPVEGSG